LYGETALTINSHIHIMHASYVLDKLTAC